MGNLFTCCKEDEYESEWYFSSDSLPKDDIECKLDWSNLPAISPTESDIQDLYRKEYLYYNRYRIDK